MKILFPIDMTIPVPAIVEQVSSVLPLAGHHVHLLYVNEAWPSYENVLGAAGDFADDWRRQIQEKAQATLSSAEALLAGKCAGVSKEIVSGPPAMMIETVAKDENCQLTVLMPGKHSKLAQVIYGSVSSKVAKHGPGTILILRPMESPAGQLRQVLIGVDGSQNAKEAMLKAVEIFKLNENKARVLLFHAVDVADPLKFISPVEFISAVEQNLVLEGETFLADSKRLLADAGVTNVEIALKQGKPANELIETAKALPADLIILGAEGKTAVQHFLLGSVSQAVASHAPCAVALVKREHKPASHS